MDDEWRKATSFIESNTPNNTRKSRDAAMQAFTLFCAERQCEVDVSAPMLTMFVRYMVQDKRRTATTARSYCYQLGAHFAPSGSRPHLSLLVQQALRAAAAAGPIVSRRKLPATAQQLRVALRRHLEHRGDFVHLRAAMVWLLGFLGFLRQSELVALNMADIWIDSMASADGERRDAVFVLIRKSKCDQERKGHTVVLAASEHAAFSPVAIVTDYLVARNNRLGINRQSALFTSMHNPFNRIGKDFPNKTVKEDLRLMGVVDWQMYGSHSLRRGGASEGWRQGISEVVLRRHGRWKSDAIFLYLVPSEAELASVSAALLG